jgi:ATP-binding cassette subfamily C (CFTR/MRP) protein 1
MVMWQIIFLLPLIFYFYYIIQNKYRKTSRELKRLISSRRSPIISCLTTSLTGLSTIQSYNIKNYMLDKMFIHLDKYSQTWYLSWGKNSIFLLIIFIFL